MKAVVAGASSSDLVTVFVRLLGEGSDAWRPVDARRVGTTIYQIVDQAAPDGETWIFQPGDVVVAERVEDGADSPFLMAVAQVAHCDELSWARCRWIDPFPSASDHA